MTRTMKGSRVKRDCMFMITKKRVVTRRTKRDWLNMGDSFNG